MDQQFSLSWNNFHGNLSKGFAGLLGTGEFVDVTIAVEGHLLQAHKVILSICSPYFKKMFQSNPCQHPIVVLRDVTHKSMRDLLQFMYHGEVSVKREDLTSFIGTAEVLQIKGLTNKQTDEENIVEKEPEVQKSNSEPHQSSPAKAEETAETETLNGASTDESTENNDIDLMKQRQFLERLQRISHLKRKSEEFLQKNYYTTDIFNFDKRIRKDKPYNSIQNNGNLAQSNNYEQFRHVFDENPVDASTNYNSQTKPDPPPHKRSHNELNQNKPDQTMSTNGNLELKTECEENDIIVTDPAVCTTPKTYDQAREGLNDQMDYQSPQDNALSLVMNGASENQQLPARYKYIYSRKGHKQLVHMNFVYTKHSTSHGKTAWRCVQYFSLNRCPATVETIDAMIYAINHQHNHDDSYEKLTKYNIYYEMSDVK